jgi:beta-xylosidase
MRDIFITRGPNHEFHAVWTWGWHKQSIGYAHSFDLVHWSDQREVPLMAEVPNTVHTWAPEIYWDPDNSQWLIIWSSIAEGETRNRIYWCLTADFTKFSRPAIFFDPGYDVIDATLLHTRSRYYLIFKDQTKAPLTYKLRIAEGHKLQGPWINISDTLTESWSEGPSALKIGDYYFIYYDHYRAVPESTAIRYEALRSSDLKNWVPINDRISFPEGCKHGSFLKITRQEAERIEAIGSGLPVQQHLAPPR